MIEQTGATYQGSQYAKALMASDAKLGKTFFLTLSLLGLLPWQKKGAVVSKPSHLHVISVDANALGGIQRGARDLCGAGDEALGFRVYNIQDDFNKIHTSDEAWDLSFYQTLETIHLRILDRVDKEKGVHAVLMSSLTGIAAGLLRGIQGPPGQLTGGGDVKKGTGMDQAKWGAFASQVSEIRAKYQLDKYHMLWEAHIYKPADTGQEGKNAVPKKETLQIPGSSGVNFPYNVEQFFRVRRNFGGRYKDTGVDLSYLDTAPSADFILGGRNVTEALEPKEFDMTYAFQKLGLKTGNWGAPSAPVKKKKVV